MLYNIILQTQNQYNIHFQVFKISPPLRVAESLIAETLSEPRKW